MEEELRAELEKIKWPIEHGSVKVQIRYGKVTLITIEKTIKVD